MKKLLTSLPLKIAAVLLSYVMVLTLAASLFAVAFMGYEGLYYKSKQTLYNETFGDMAMNKAFNILEYYNPDENNFVYEDIISDTYYKIVNSNNETVVTNYNGEKVLLSREESINEYTCTVYILEDTKNNDEISALKWLIDTGYSLRYAVIAFAVLSVMAVIVCFSYLCCAAGQKKNYNGIYIGYLDMLPTDIYLGGIAAYCIFCYLLLSGGSYFEGLESAILIFVLSTILYFLSVGFIISLSKRIKLRTVFKNTLIYKVCVLLIKCGRAVGKFLLYFLKKLPLVWKTLIVIIPILFIQAIYMLVTLEWYNVTAYILWFGFDLLLSVAVIYISIILQTIKKGGDKIAAGDITYKIDTRFMIFDFKDFSQKLNGISDGLSLALNEKMKSEMFKTELITNVSHDIKTPLTSIINYVDLLKKEDIQNEVASGYIETLDRQSDRLKKLIEDLVEASKAATGNMKVNLAPCDIGVLLSQSIGEFDERFNKAFITPVLKKPEKSVIIMADARHLWRITDNLLNNICKYSQSDTRAYIDVRTVNSKAVIIFKNISRYELDITPDELMERFVRGDKSRHTDGSGLGLSIAKSLTELQNGSMDIEVDGDLFKVTLTFDIKQ